MEKNWMQQLQDEKSLAKILETNQETEQYGLVLSEEDAKSLVAWRAKSLKEQKRVEFSGGITEKLIREFCDSEYIGQEEYVEIIARLQDIFYLYKNEMMDEITDDELLHVMKELFEMVCFGDLEYLESTCLDNFARAIRAGYQEFRKTEGHGEGAKFVKVPRFDYDLFMQVLNELVE